MWIKPQFPEGPHENRPGWGVLARGAYTGTGRVRTQGFGIRMDNFDPNDNTVLFEHCEAIGRGISSPGTFMKLPPDWVHISETFSNVGHVSAPGHPLVVGRFLIPSEDHLQGQIAEIRIWDGAKASYTPQYDGKALTGNEPGLIACWTFDEGRGQIAHDISPNANHARLGRSIHADDADPTWMSLSAEPQGATLPQSGGIAEQTDGLLAWQRDRHLEQAKAEFASQLPQFKEALLTGGSDARYQVLSTIQSNRMAEILDDSFVPAMQAAGSDPDPRVRNEIAWAAGYRWVWSAKQQDPNVIELMLKLSSDSDREVRYNSVYYGLSIVRDKSEPVVRRLVGLALADQEQSFYGRIVWGLNGPTRADRELVERVLVWELKDGATESERATARRLYQDVLGQEAPPIRDVSGRVVDPAGNPIAGVQVALANKHQAVTILPPKLRLGHVVGRANPVAETDAEGRFLFPEVLGEFVMFASHETGFACVEAEELTPSAPIRLERWGQIEGTLYVGRKPAPGEVMTLSLAALHWYDPFVSYDDPSETDPVGRFVFRRVVPGSVELARHLPWWKDSGTRGSWFRQSVYVRPGETLKIAIGGTGRPVVGRLILPADNDRSPDMTWTGPTLTAVRPETPRPAGYDQMTVSQRDQWHRRWIRTSEGRAYFESLANNSNLRSYIFSMDKDNSFRIEDVTPGRYEFMITLRKPAPPAVAVTFAGPYHAFIEVPKMTETYSDEPLDLGEVPLEECGRASRV